MDADNRNVEFEFNYLRCGFEMNADINAGINIWTSRMTYIYGSAAHVRPVFLRQARLPVVKRQNEPCPAQFEVYFPKSTAVTVLWSEQLGFQLACVGLKVQEPMDQGT